MHKIYIYIIAQIISVCALAQESSIYSRYGLGILSNSNSQASNMMGGLGASYRGIEGPNYINPASISAIKLISFDAGISGIFENIKTTEIKAKQNSFNFEYLSISLPIKNYWSTSIGIMPYSKKDYQFVNLTEVDSINTNKLENNGSGNLNKVAWSNGFKIKDLSLGFSLGYIFGKFDNISASNVLTNGFYSSSDYTTYQKNTTTHKILNLDLGAQYTLVINGKKDTLKPYKIDFGISVNMPFALNKSQEYNVQLRNFSNQILGTRAVDESLSDFINDKVENATFLQQVYRSTTDANYWKQFIPDTISINTISNAGIKIPPAFNFGAILYKDYKYKIGFDFRYQPWSRYKGFEDNETSKLSNSWRLGFGGEIIPNINKYNKFFSKLKYRAGFYYSKTNISIRNTDVNEFGIDFGVGIPMFNRYSSTEGFMQSYITYPFNIGVQIGKRGTTKDNLVQENFVRFRIGFSLNDKWFVKRKYY
jgi:hypothetical protein